MKNVIIIFTVMRSGFSVGEYVVFKSDNFGFCLALGIYACFLIRVRSVGNAAKSMQTVRP